jgi:excisionase family DNA binding protein
MEPTRRFEDLDDILSVDETAAFLRVGRSLVYDAIRVKTIPAVRIGKRILVPKSGLKQFVDAHEPVS